MIEDKERLVDEDISQLPDSELPPEAVPEVRVEMPMQQMMDNFLLNDTTSANEYDTSPKFLEQTIGFLMWRCRSVANVLLWNMEEIRRLQVRLDETEAKLAAKTRGKK